MAKRSSRTSRSTKPRKRKPAMIVEEETTRVIPVEQTVFRQQPITLARALGGIPLAREITVTVKRKAA
jgi:hypothetical protein